MTSRPQFRTFAPLDVASGSNVSSGKRRVATAGAAIPVIRAVITGDEDPETLDGSGAADTISGNGGNDVLSGLGGHDLIDGGDEDDTLYGGAGDDTLDGGFGADDLYGESGNDLLRPSWNLDHIVDGGGGSDTIDMSHSFAGFLIDLEQDIVNSSVVGGLLVADLVSIENAIGGDGGDLIVGTRHANLLDGGEGDDTLSGGGDGDTLDGGEGIDWADYSSAAKTRADLQVPSSNTGEAVGDSYVDIENLAGGEGNDVLRGDGGGNILSAGDGNDVLTGRGGNDTLIGGDGVDRMTGDGGADRFALGANPAGGIDTIFDFVAGEDKVQLDAAGYSLSPGALSASAFHTGNSATDAAHRIIYREASGKLYFDPDGNGAQAQVLVAVLENLPTIAASDFIVT